MTKYKTPTAWKSNVGPFAGGSFSQKFMWKPFINLICLWLTCVNPWVWSSWPKKCIFMPSLKALQVFFESLLFKSVFLKWIVMSLWPGMMVAWKLKVLWIQFLQPTWVMIWQVFWETRIVNQKIHIHIYNIHIHLHICICIYTYHILWFTLW